MQSTTIGSSFLCKATRVVKVPFMYLALSIGGERLCTSLWELVVTRIRSRLYGWKSRLLYFGGRLVLLKSVLTSLPVYALSVFKALSEELGGLGVRKLREVEGGDRAIRRGGGRFCKYGMTWVMRGWFRESIERRVGNGHDTFFWTDPWLGGVLLSVKYRCMFDLSLSKTGTITAMRDLGWEDGVAAWLWRHKWLWRHDPSGGYIVRGAYNLLPQRHFANVNATTDLICHKQIPLKVFILAWWTTLFGLLIPPKARELAALSYSFFGYAAFRWCGMSETIDYSRLRKLQFTRC
ncbi:hypothetical protein TSUD_99330 [Trifolium subterraneum]|uniref:Reverse transcriptase zinc-binding domain-containing protein n=1 Tax=Trifolium subterraneum TaxID=3900 RepID=A0A2Z6LRK3_TRISU|nr:hypothetical protein TSUD_99330 [Trifolium subterraneum]